MEDQNKVSNMVEREVYCCASILISGVAEIAGNLGYKKFDDAFGCSQEDLIDLCQRPDYEEAARMFIMDDADVDQLQEVAEKNGYWEDVLSASKVPEVSVDEDECYRLPDSTELFDDEDDAQASAIESVLSEIRKQVWAITTNYEEICQNYNLDTDYLEVYEHWVVSDWLADQLAKRGEIIGEFAGLTIWGRCCSGQSISMDCVIRDIARNLWG